MRGIKVSCAPLGCLTTVLTGVAIWLVLGHLALLDALVTAWLQARL